LRSIDSATEPDYFTLIAAVEIAFSLFQLVGQKKFALSNPNIYKTANRAAAAGAVMGELRQRLAVKRTLALCLAGKNA